MTYSESAVVETINRLVVPLQVVVTESSAAPLIQRFRQAWTPDLHLLGPDAFDYDHWNGYLPPFEFLPRLLVGAAQARLRMNDLVSAASLEEEVIRRFPTSHVAPEAVYFLAVARYKASHKTDDLLGVWQYLQRRYPDSIWRLKQSFTEIPPATAHL